MLVLENLACPNCQGIMEAGFLVTMTGLHWTTQETVGKHLVPNMQTDDVYPDNEGAFLENPRYKAARCPNCNVMIFLHKKL